MSESKNNNRESNPTKSIKTLRQNCVKKNSSLSSKHWLNFFLNLPWNAQTFLEWQVFVKNYLSIFSSSHWFSSHWSQILALGMDLKAGQRGAGQVATPFGGISPSSIFSSCNLTEFFSSVLNVKNANTAVWQFKN